ncbi:major pollen allergen Bet v 1-D/H-like [Primulina huaijiensis]|uniref:major pollen allergen Bet v 1-D/H-like n=1 Tax=Primulina huaijiensis TaxID=1492673 RepID=UPI003CC71EB9
MTLVEFSHELKVNVSPKRMFKALIIDAHHLLPNIIPHIFKSIDILEGEGGTAGCVRKTSFPDGAPFPHLMDKFEVVDKENLLVKVVVMEGPIFGEKLEALESEKRFMDSGDGGCIIKWKTKQHLKPGHTHVSVEEIKNLKQLSVSFLSATEAYLVAHPDVCEQKN